MSSLESLLDIATSRGLWVEWVPMRPGARAHYMHAKRLIVLDSSPRLTCIIRETLAHELGHAHYAHDGSRSHECPEWERLADDYAARLLIQPDRYATAESEVGPDACGLAELLDVPPGVVTRWQRLAHATPSLLIG